MLSLLFQPSDVASAPTFAVEEEAAAAEQRAPIRRAAPLLKRRAAEPCPARTIRLIASRSLQAAKAGAAPSTCEPSHHAALTTIAAALADQTAALAFFSSLRPSQGAADTHGKLRP